MLIQKTNEPTPNNPYKIPIGSRSFAIVDSEDLESLSRNHWRLVKSNRCFYAARRFRKNGRVFEIKMHRDIMHTPPGYDCHHKNHNTLDNRKSNLENLTPDQHRAAHFKV